MDQTTCLHAVLTNGAARRAESEAAETEYYDRYGASPLSGAKGVYAFLKRGTAMLRQLLRILRKTPLARARV